MVKNYSSKPSPYPMPISGIQGQVLEVTVVGCNKLKDTEWISRQDPYVNLEYSSTKFRTRTHTDGGKNPTFQEKFVFTMIEGLLEFSVAVWNSNTVSSDSFIGSGRIQLQKVLSQGYDDSLWTIQDRRGRHAGEVRLIMHYANANKPAASSHAPSAPPFVGTPYAMTHPPSSATVSPAYPPASSVYPPSPYHHQPAAYPPTYPPSSSYPSQSVYPSTYPPPPSSYSYPPQSVYPQSSYPPGTYPPPPPY